MRRDAWLALIVLVAVLAAMASKSMLVSIPPVRSHAVEGGFDTRSAKARLQRILGDERPHPSDSEANDAVRGRLVAELNAIGLKPIVRDQFACNDFAKARTVSCTRARNVIAVLGPPAGKALLLNAHYDSAPASPGAADDGIGVATLLEVARLMKDRQLQRPVVFLFNEGEELGLVGARAFLRDPLSRNVDSVLNFEARGITGPVVMFETSAPNGAAVKAFGDAVDRPFASSMATDLYRLLPNGTDVTTFSERGWLALNFAMVGNETRYHSPGDNLAALDDRSLQHMGDQALAMTERLADGVPEAKGDRIFVDVLGRFLVQMSLAVGLAIFAALAIAVSVLAIKRRAWFRAPLAVLLALVLATALAWLGDFVMSALRPGTFWRAHPELTLSAVYASAMLGALIPLRTLAAGIERERMRLAYWLVFLLLGAALASVAPGAIIYFMLPPLIVLAGVGLRRWRRRAEDVAALVALAVLFLTWGEMLAQVEQLFSPGPQWVVAPVGALVMIAALVEAGPLLQRAGRALVLVGAAILALAGWAVVGVAPAYAQDRQQMFSVQHVTAPDGRASWAVSNDRAPLPHGYGNGAKWEREALPHGKRKLWTTPAPTARIRPVTVEVLGSRNLGARRAVQLRLRSNGAMQVALRAPANSRLERAGTEGFMRPLGAGGDEFTVACVGRSCDGAVLTLVFATSRPAPLTVIGTRPGLPPGGEALLRQRPRHAQPQYSADQTVVVSKIKI
ncbi:M20/M25/M40 family metallo-hydrolase [Sphingomonas sinipercae]|uniref:Vacuolar membrane protease n=1 Tax=Sphingomonas sinipercae TaxID=2714944 RepID=A0A6G7ZNY8_9SPHN|nr:M20/M25/M40 family metallo-hydrolase [Sphingomonas sinipercae]QIL02645.1 M20/M25/M40 family metallo-hydrolase [Sphingomonas sinipercae]